MAYRPTYGTMNEFSQAPPVVEGAGTRLMRSLMAIQSRKDELAQRHAREARVDAMRSQESDALAKEREQKTLQDQFAHEITLANIAKAQAAETAGTKASADVMGKIGAELVKGANGEEAGGPPSADIQVTAPSKPYTFTDPVTGHEISIAAPNKEEVEAKRTADFGKKLEEERQLAAAKRSMVTLPDDPALGKLAGQSVPEDLAQVLLKPDARNGAFDNVHTVSGGYLTMENGKPVFHKTAADPSADSSGDLLMPGTSAVTSLEGVPERHRASVKAMLDYRAQPSDFIRGGSRQSDQLRNQLVEWAHSIDPSYDAKQYGARSAAVKAFGSGTQGQNLVSLNTAERHLKTLEDAAKKLPGHGGVPGATTLNAVQNFLSKSAGKKYVTDFNSVRDKLAREIDRAFTGAGALAEEGVKREISSLGDSMSAEQLAGSVKRVREMLSGRRNELADSYERIVGRPLSADTIRKVPGETSTSSSTPTVTTKDQYDALPAGATYLDSEGNRYVKK